MIFDLLTPPQGGGGRNHFAVARPIFVSDSHTKFVWISSSGLGGNSITDGRTHGQMDRSDITISTLLFFLVFVFKKSVWINIRCLLNFFS